STGHEQENNGLGGRLLVRGLGGEGVRRRRAESIRVSHVQVGQGTKTREVVPQELPAIAVDSDVFRHPGPLISVLIFGAVATRRTKPITIAVYNINHVLPTRPISERLGADGLLRDWPRGGK